MVAIIGRVAALASAAALIETGWGFAAFMAALAFLACFYRPGAGR